MESPEDTETTQPSTRSSTTTLLFVVGLVARSGGYMSVFNVTSSHHLSPHPVLCNISPVSHHTLVMLLQLLFNISHF